MLARFAGYDTPRAVFPSIVNARGDSTGAVLGQVIALADEARGDSTVAVAGQGVHARCCCCVWCLWPDSAENCGDSTGAVPGQGVHARCCCIVWCHLPDNFMVQRQISMVQSIQLIIVIPLSPFVFGGRCPCCAVVQVLTCKCGGDTRAPTAAARCEL